MLNKILNSANARILVTNLFGPGALRALDSLRGLPLGTSDGSATGEIALKVKLIGGLPHSTGAVLFNGVQNLSVYESLQARQNIIALNGDLEFFGSGGDGNLAAGAGATVLARSMYYNNVTLNATDKLSLNGWKLFVAGTLDISLAGANAINGVTTTAGGNAAGATAGGIAVNTTGTDVGTGGASAAGKAGTTAAGTAGGAAVFTSGAGGSAGASGAGGTGIAGTVAGGAAGTIGAITTITVFLRLCTDLLKGQTIIPGGGQGPAGGSGGGSGAGLAGGSGASGLGGGVGAIFARTIVRTSGSTAANAINFAGGNGGNGGDSPTATSGGGGGSAGGGGGWIYLVYRFLGGSAAANALNVSGGNGGNGGVGNTTGNGGNGANGGNGGRIIVIDLNNETLTHTDGTTTAGSAGTAAVGTVAGTGGAGVVTRANL